ncbi:hypothetical protein GBA52_004482 [Prunus armeniaca]|nr:hypothetical protein GBA52_004482 [Prunus armeniaca]
MGHDSDFKSQLVTEICSISTRSIACSHGHGCSNSPAKSSSFIDWYRLLRVQENAGRDVIRKRYHELALQLHPDKNKHPKAEIAFKLVSEAYSCLSDNAKRRAFDLARWRKFCFECGTIPYTTHKTSSNANASEHKACNPTSSSRSCKVVKGLKDIRNRFREEARVIENCLRANAAAAPRRESSLFSPPAAYDVFQSRSSRESPIFNPSDHKVQGYPHLRTRIHSKPQNFWHLRTGHQVLNYEPSRATYDSPVFEVRSDKAFFKSRSTCVRS